MNKDKEIAGDQPALRQRAEERLKKNGLIPDMLSSKEELQRIVHELSVHQIELEMQKEELLHSRDQLEEALTKYTDLYDFAPLGYLTLSADSTILEANLTAAKLLGIDRALLIGDRCIRFVDHTDRNHFNTFMALVLSQHEHQTVELLVQNKEYGDASALSLSGKIMRLDAIASENGHECRLTISDITRQRQLEKENAGLQQSKKVWEHSILSLFENFPDPVFQLDSDFNILAANKAFCALFGKTQKQILNTNAFDLLPPELAKTRKQKFVEAIGSGKALFFEDERDGEILRSSLYPINEGGGRLLVMVQNVTKTKAIEQKLKTQEAFNQAIINSLPGVYFIVDHNGQFIGGNNYLREVIIGDPHSNITGAKVLELLHPDDREEGIALIERLINNNTPPPIPFEARVLYHGGPEYRWLVSTASKAVIDGLDYIIGMGIDITNHKADEKALIESEERFRKLFESPAAVNMVMDTETGSIIDANQAAAKFYGWTVEELKKMNVEDIIVASHEEIREIIETTIKGKQQEILFRHRTADGSIRDVEVYGNTILTNGKILIFAIIIDVTERKRFETLADGIITTDIQGTITTISPMALHLFGAKDKAKLLGKAFTTLVHTRDTRNWENILHEHPDNAAIRTLELLCKKGKNATFLTEITALPTHNAAGLLHSYQLIIRDITQKKLIEQKHQQTRSLIELGEMAFGVAHEIMQPINTISLLADKMLEKAKTESLDLNNTVTKEAKKIAHNIARMQTIVDNIRGFASKDQNAAATKFDCKEPIHSVITITQKECREKSIELAFHSGPEKLPIRGNLYKVEQVILNLIRNSIDALEEKREQLAVSSRQSALSSLSTQPSALSPSPFICIFAKRQKESVIISIEDNGIGISQQNIHYILQPFFTTKESGKGTGLGLSISSSIIKEMNGKLSITSTPMEGTTVQLIIPFEERPYGEH